MASGLVNHTNDRLNQGVSRQFDEDMHESQVKEMINCIPSISDGVYRRNPTTLLKELSTDPNTFVYTYDRGTPGEQYMITVTSNGMWNVRNLNTGDLISNNSDPYLVCNNPSKELKALTVGDYTFIVNTTKTVKMDPLYNKPERDNFKYGVYYIKKTINEIKETKTTTDGGTQTTGHHSKGLTYSLLGQTVEAVSESRPGETPVELYSGDQIAAKLRVDVYNNVNPYEGIYANFTAYNSLIYATNLNKTGSSWEWSDSMGNEASFGFRGEVQKSEDLPINLPDDLIGMRVNVTGASSDSEDDYWLEWTGSTWKETSKPGINYAIDRSTMPHVFIRQADGTFTFDQYAWDNREVGDENTCPLPSFIDTTIQNILFHENRLGFITSDNIILSEQGTYSNFWNTTVRNIPDTDPIDLAVATTDVNSLRDTVSTNNTLVLFSDEAQFTLSSNTGVLTPETATLTQISNYNYNKEVGVKAIGDLVLFTSNIGNSNKLFAYKLIEGNLKSVEATEVSLHVPGYLPSTLFKSVGHSTLGMWFSTDGEYIYILNFVIQNREIIQLAFHKWTISTWAFNESILDLQIVNNILYITTTATIYTITLETPSDFTTVTYLDTGTTPYTSSITLDKWYLRNGKNQGTPRGRLQIRTMEYTIDPKSSYETVISKDNYNLVRSYKNDSKVTVMGNNKDTTIIFKENPDEPSKGFRLNTINYEGLFTQRSERSQRIY